MGPLVSHRVRSQLPPCAPRGCTHISPSAMIISFLPQAANETSATLNAETMLIEVVGRKTAHVQSKSFDLVQKNYKTTHFSHLEPISLLLPLLITGMVQQRDARGGLPLLGPKRSKVPRAFKVRPSSYSPASTPTDPVRPRTAHAVQLLHHRCHLLRATCPALHSARGRSCIHGNRSDPPSQLSQFLASESTTTTIDAYSH